VKDLRGQSLDTTVDTITAEGLSNSASNLIPEGTVIIASRVGLGKAAINRRPVAINQDLKALTPRTKELLPWYLLQFLLSKADYFERSGVGATVKGLTIPDYQKLDIPVPPLAEQERIVKLLDEADGLRKLTGAPPPSFPPYSLNFLATQQTFRRCGGRSSQSVSLLPSPTVWQTSWTPQQNPRTERGL